MSDDHCQLSGDHCQLSGDHEVWRLELEQCVSVAISFAHYVSNFMFCCQALALFSQPAVVPDALQLLLHLVDDIWCLAGDQSVDVSFHVPGAKLVLVCNLVCMLLCVHPCSHFIPFMHVPAMLNHVHAMVFPLADVCYCSLVWQ